MISSFKTRYDTHDSRLFIISGDEEDVEQILDWAREHLDDKRIDVYPGGQSIHVRGEHNLALFKLTWGT